MWHAASGHDMACGTTGPGFWHHVPHVAWHVTCRHEAWLHVVCQLVAWHDDVTCWGVKALRREGCAGMWC